VLVFQESTSYSSLIIMPNQTRESSFLRNMFVENTNQDTKGEQIIQTKNKNTIRDRGVSKQANYKDRYNTYRCSLRAEPFRLFHSAHSIAHHEPTSPFATEQPPHICHLPEHSMAVNIDACRRRCANCSVRVSGRRTESLTAWTSKDQ
jgi:hypothetical protein